MTYGLYISHPEVNIEPHVPVNEWGLSETGRKRARAFAMRDLIPAGTTIFSSKETKARELADILAARHSLSIIARADLGENDRSATGYLEAEKFETHVKKLFARPKESVAGWEPAARAQTRIVEAVRQIIGERGVRDPLLFCGHGCVGTLLKCHLARRPLNQSEDQRQRAHPGGGNLFVFDLAPLEMLCDWTPMENWKGI